jgi:hypothetical protein
VNGLDEWLDGATRKTLLKIKGFSEVKVEKVKEAIQKCLPTASGFITAGLNSLYVLNRYCTHPFRIASNCLLPVEMRTTFLI